MHSIPSFRFAFALRLRPLRGARRPPASGRSGSGEKRDAVWEEKGLVTKFPKDGPPVVWRQADRRGLRRPRGRRAAASTSWTASRPPPTPTEPAAEGHASRAPSALHCLNAADGKTVWTHTYDCPYINVAYPTGPRTTPVVDGDRLYTLGTMGDLLCLNAADGKPRLVEELPEGLQGPDAGVGLVGAPAARRRHARSRSSAATARRWSRSTRRPARRSGRRSRRRKSATPPPVITEAGGKRQLIVWLVRGGVLARPGDRGEVLEATSTRPRAR